MSKAELELMDIEGRQRAWEGFCELVAPRTAKALRLLLGLSPSQAAVMAGLPEHVLLEFETPPPGGFASHAIARRLHHTYSRMGASWCAPDLHDGLYLVTLDTPRGASDRAAIGAALALMGWSAKPPHRPVKLETLARRVAKRLRLSPAEVRAELAGQKKLSKRVRAEAFRQLGRGRDGAGAYFRPAAAGGWRLVGADSAGCWW
jgi:hypothetical protein